MGFIGFHGKVEASATRCLPALVKKSDNSEYPVKCLVYDANLPWTINIANQLVVSGAAFFTQSCAAIANYYRMYVEMFDEQLPVLDCAGLKFHHACYHLVQMMQNVIPL
jgi:hypothetical protein